MLFRWVVSIVLFGAWLGASTSCYLDPDTQCLVDSDCRPNFLCKDKRCVCRQGLEQCGVDCVDLKTSANHCGACNNVCTGSTPRCACPKEDAKCEKAAAKPSCTAGCPTGQTDCGTACVADFASNNDHCGRCGVVCTGDYRCGEITGPSGQAQIKCMCPSGTEDCGGVCVNKKTNKDHCGSCNNACAAGQVCLNSTCSTCPAERRCGSECPDKKSDPAHCGDCNKKCDAGQDCCDGGCVNLKTDQTYCGSCTTKCRSDQMCDTNACKCMGGKENCPTPVNACVDVLTDAKNCGQCEKICPQDSPICIEGICCKTGEKACASGSGKICADLNKDPDNCGTCGTSCNGQICDGMTCKKCTSDSQCASGLTCDNASGRCLCGSGCNWLKSLGTSKASVWTLGVAVSPSQDVYIGGEFSGTIRTEKGDTYVSQGAATNLFFARLDSAGRLKWFRSIQATGATSIIESKRVRLAVGSDEHLYVATTISGAKDTKITVDTGVPQLSLRGGSDIFVGKLDSNGKWLWALSTGGEGEDYANGLALGSNKVYIAGRFQKTAAFGTITLVAKDNTGKPAPSDPGLFVAIIDPAGTFTNAITINGKSEARDIVVDSVGNAYITGKCNSGDFDGIKTQTAGDSIFVAKIDNTLKFSWVQAGLGGGDGKALALRTGVGVEVAGTYGGTIQFGEKTLLEPPKASGQGTGTGFLVARLREANGRLDWVTTGHSLETQEVRDLALDASGVSSVVVFAKGDLIVGTQTFKSEAKQDSFIVTLDSQGSPLAKQFLLTGPSDDIATAIAMDAAGSLYIVGYFGDTLNLRPSAPPLKIDPAGTIDSFFWKTK